MAARVIACPGKTLPHYPNRWLAVISSEQIAKTEIAPADGQPAGATRSTHATPRFGSGGSESVPFGRLHSVTGARAMP